MSKINISLRAAFMLEYGPWSRRFCRVLEAIAKWRLMLSKNPLKNSLFILFGRRSLSFVGCCKVKHLRVIFSENRVSEDTHEKSIFLLFRQNVPLSEVIQGKIV